MSRSQGQETGLSFGCLISGHAFATEKSVPGTRIPWNTHAKHFTVTQYLNYVTLFRFVVQ